VLVYLLKAASMQLRLGFLGGNVFNRSLQSSSDSTYSHCCGLSVKLVKVRRQLKHKREVAASEKKLKIFASEINIAKGC
jgi:hypothetical protein